MSSGAFGDDTKSTLIRSVNCYGNETDMLNCSYSTSGLGMCSEHSAAVICQGQKSRVACAYMTTCMYVCVHVCNKHG